MLRIVMLSITVLSITTLSIAALSIAQHNGTQHKNSQRNNSRLNYTEYKNKQPSTQHERLKDIIVMLSVIYSARGSFVVLNTVLS
jgi:hypothetical protein